MDGHGSDRPRPHIVEVLSAATERLDREEKFQAFRHLESLQEYLLVSQEKRLVEVFRRETDWRPEYCGDGDSIPVRSVNLDLPVAVVYEDLE